MKMVLGFMIVGLALGLAQAAVSAKTAPSRRDRSGTSRMRIRSVPPPATPATAPGPVSGGRPCRTRCPSASASPRPSPSTPGRSGTSRMPTRSVPPCARPTPEPGPASGGRRCRARCRSASARSAHRRAKRRSTSKVRLRRGAEVSLLAAGPLDANAAKILGSAQRNFCNAAIVSSDVVQRLASDSFNSLPRSSTSSQILDHRFSVPGPLRTRPCRCWTTWVSSWPINWRPAAVWG